MYCKLVTNLEEELIRYPHLKNKSGNVLISDNQPFYYEEYDNLIEDAWNIRNNDNSLEPYQVYHIYNDVYKKLHHNIRNRIKLVTIDIDLYLNNSEIRLGLTQTGRDPHTFNQDEKLILNICGHIGLFDIYNIKGNRGMLIRESLNQEERKKILDKYQYDQEVLKVLKEDGFKEINDWDTNEILYNLFDNEH